MNTNGLHNFKSLYYKFRYSKLPRLQFGSVTWSSARRSWLPSARTALSWSHLCVFCGPHTTEEIRNPRAWQGEVSVPEAAVGRRKVPVEPKCEPDSSQNRVPRKTSQRCFRKSWVQTESRKLMFSKPHYDVFYLKSIKHCHLTISEILEYHVEIIRSKQTTKKKTIVVFLNSS